LIDDTRTKNVLKQEPVEFREQSWMHDAH
jgi:hypothetical protein